MGEDMGRAKALSKDPVARNRVKAIVCSKPLLAVGRSCFTHSERPAFKKIHNKGHIRLLIQLSADATR